MKINKNTKFDRRLSLFILYSPNHRLLLQKRDLNAPTLPGYWAFFGGSIENGEFPIDAVRREANEELGIKLHNPVFLNRYVMYQEKKYVEKYIFLEKLEKSISQLKKDQKEGSTLGLFKIANIKKDIRFPHFNLIIINDIEKFLKKQEDLH